MHTHATTDSRGAQCAAPATSPGGAAPVAVPAGGSLPSRPLFPPKDADAEARRHWLATSPWPEVVFAASL